MTVHHIPKRLAAELLRQNISAQALWDAAIDELRTYYEQHPDAPRNKDAWIAAVKRAVKRVKGKRGSICQEHQPE